MKDTEKERKMKEKDLCRKGKHTFLFRVYVGSRGKTVLSQRFESKSEVAKSPPTL